MKKLQTEFLRWTQYLLELVTIYVLLFPFHVNGGEGFSSYPPFIITALSAAAIYGFFYGKLRSLKLAAAAIPLIAWISFFNGYYLFIAILLAVVFFWRVTAIQDEHDQEIEYRLFFITMTAGIFYYLTMNAVPAREHLLVLILFSFLLTAIVKALSVTLRSGTGGKETIKYISYAAGLLGALAVFSAAAGPLYIWLQTAVLFVVRIAILSIALLLSPLVYLFQYIPPLEIPEQMAEINESTDEWEAFREEREAQYTTSLVDWEIIGLVTGSILLLLFLIYILKRAKTKKNNVLMHDNSLDEKLSAVKKDSFLSRFISQVKPAHEVRRQFLALENALAKRGYGRRPDQTVQEWLNSLPIDREIKTQIAAVYYKVRYSNGNVSNEERESFKEAVKKARQQMAEKKTG
ncbi:DUF4129 domain-containing protein [Evansella clarkii]|uniref:DUF4129 domain-containing protein n=1 Tax=Evansella clarkii TaxID=79879 RepID=UPI00142FEE47|nr:DUF4129 domain-containing protein [Evansella clarkii]